MEDLSANLGFTHSQVKQRIKLICLSKAIRTSSSSFRNHMDHKLSIYLACFFFFFFFFIIFRLQSFSTQRLVMVRTEVWYLTCLIYLCSSKRSSDGRFLSWRPPRAGTAWGLVARLRCWAWSLRVGVRSYPSTCRLSPQIFQWEGGDVCSKANR